MVPDMPLAVRNNCQSGKWTIGDAEYGSKVSMTIIKFSKFFGTLGQTSNTLWGQIWFIAESGELPKGVVMVTYIKGRSLQDFSRLVATVQARGIEPAEGIFVPEFTKHSGQKPDENGVPKPINYYSLAWNWVERTGDQMATLDQAAAALSDNKILSRLLDLDGTKQMVCLDNMPAHEVAQLLGAYSTGIEPASSPAALGMGEDSYNETLNG